MNRQIKDIINYFNLKHYSDFNVDILELRMVYYKNVDLNIELNLAFDCVYGCYSDYSLILK